MSGNLTAEQVMAIMGKHQPDYCSDTHVCFDWQAIADELNATLENGICERAYEPALKRELTDDELEILDAMPALKHLAMKAGLI